MADIINALIILYIVAVILTCIILYISQCLDQTKLHYSGKSLKDVSLPGSISLAMFYILRLILPLKKLPNTVRWENQPKIF